jgi:N-acetylmuramoyl-L-alanine amidase
VNWENIPPVWQEPSKLLELVVWRESRNQPYEAMLAVAWSIMNRVNNPGWWGNDLPSVIMKPWQYTSMTGWGDPQLELFPRPGDPSDDQAIQAGAAAQAGTPPDPSLGATHYYDKSLDSNPPAWTKAATSVHLIDIASLRFWRVQ